MEKILTGMRTTGKLHLGHKTGALDLWLKYQQKQVQCFFLLADVQALTTHDDPDALYVAIKDAVIDWLSIGLNPELSNVRFVQQSQIPERAELSMLLMMVAKYGELIRNPTLKTELARQANASVGFMIYPIDEAADIYMVADYPPKDGDKILVPAGEDQEPLIELANDITTRFNYKYGSVFCKCELEKNKVSRLVGTDGQAKMSKSIGNTILLSDPPEEVEKKVMSMFTDPNRLRATDPGETQNNPVFIYHRAFNENEEEVAELTDRYHKGKVGDVEVKKRLIKVINTMLEPIRERRAEVLKEPIYDIIYEGTREARVLCQEIVGAVKHHMRLEIPK